MKNKAWKLRTRRILLGLSQWEVARRVGKSAAWLSLVERGYINPTSEMLDRFKKAVERPLESEPRR